MQLFLIRHTTPQITAGLCYGQSDIDVAASFIQESNAVKSKLNQLKHNGLEIHALYSSPLQRCTKLAHALNAELNLEDVKQDHRLKELNFGDWELQAWDDIPREAFDIWADDYANLAPPKGETFGELHARAKHFIAERIEHSPDHNIVVVTHGGMIRAMLAEVLQIPLKRLFRFQIDCGSVTQLAFGSTSADVPRIVSMNS